MSMLWIKSGQPQNWTLAQDSPHPWSITSSLALLSAAPTNSCQHKPAPARAAPKNDTRGQWEWWGQGADPGPFSFSSRLKAMDPTLMSSEGGKHLWSALILHAIINLAFISCFYEMEWRISKIKHSSFFLFTSEVAPVHLCGSSSTGFPQAHFLTTWKISYTSSLNFPHVFLTDKLFFCCSLQWNVLFILMSLENNTKIPHLGGKIHCFV